MKILHVAEIVKGGVATVVNQLIEGQEVGNEVKVIVPSSQCEDINIVNRDNLITFRSKKRGMLSHLHLLKTYVCSLIKFKPDVIHIHSSFAGVICRIPLFFMPFIKCKVIYCPHAFSFMIDSNKFKKNVYVQIERFLSIVTDNIICVSDYEYKEAIRNNLNNNKLVTVYNGVKDPRVTPRDTWFENERLNVLFVGRFEKQKGYDLLEQVFLYFKNNEKIYFHVVGDFVNKDNRVYVNQLNVTTYGWLSHLDVQKLYLKTDCLIMPSRWEGLPMAALEALSFGLPILASNCSAFPEIITDSENGFLFENGNIGSIIETIEKLLNDVNIKYDLSMMSSSARCKFLESYESNKMLSDTYKLYV